jgi:hypothetical protein
MFIAKLFNSDDCLDEKRFEMEAEAIKYAKRELSRPGGEAETAKIYSAEGKLIVEIKDGDQREAPFIAYFRDGQRIHLDGSSTTRLNPKKRRP